MCFCCNNAAHNLIGIFVFLTIAGVYNDIFAFFFFLKKKKIKKKITIVADIRPRREKNVLFTAQYFKCLSNVRNKEHPVET